MTTPQHRKESPRQKTPLLIIDIVTLFPSMFSGPFSESIIQRAQEENKVEINIHNLRDWAADKRGTVDDRPYGGGKGMILRPEPIFNAVEDIKNAAARKSSSTVNKDKVEESAGSGSRLEYNNSPRQASPSTTNCSSDPCDHQNKERGLKSATPEKEKTGRSSPKCKMPNDKCQIILLTPQGQTFNQQKARELSIFNHLILICGHYEGVDERVREHLVDQEISIGDYILTGGEIPAMVVTDAVVRLIPDVLEESATSQESFTTAALKSAAFKNGGGTGILEYPQYTRPDNFRGWKVPEVLLSGNHKEIRKWRKRKAVSRTKERRPELLNSKNQAPNNK